MKKMIYLAIVIVVLLLVWQGRLLWIASGRLPTGERRARCEQSPQWRDGAFQNIHATPTLTSNKSTARALWEFLTYKVENLTPKADIPVLKQSLRDIPRSEETCVWLGHSTVFIQTQGVRFLFDPVLTNQLPVKLFMRPFRGAGAYTPDDIPDVDYLIITHDHWDHLDWKTVTALRDRVGAVVCSLGIGEHFAYWGYPAEKIHDLDWNDSISISDSMMLRCLPSRHFSGRLLGRGKTLWASYLIDGPRRIFVSGDGGYDDRFKRFGTDYPGIDLAVLENGQYSEDWHYIHTLPRELPQVISDLSPRRVLTYHNSKYALAKHAWTEPLDSIYKHAQGKAWQLLTPRIGERIDLNAEQTFSKWW